jgi:uncharacterized protein
MTLAEVIQDFATTDCNLPRASMQWALDHWEEAWPGLVDLLDRYSSGEDRSEGTAAAVFFAVHLFGQKAETQAFPALCRLMHATEACEEALGDATTETLPQVIVSTYSGDTRLLKGVIEDPAADDFVRHGALMAMAYLTRTGRIADAEMRAYLSHLHAEMQPQDECPVWVAWASSVACLGYEEYAELAEGLIERGFIDDFAMRIEDFQDDLELTRRDPEGLAGFESDRIRPFGGAIERLSQWYFFTEAYKKEQARLAAQRAAEERLNRYDPGFPYINEFRHVGWNEPCPCGSGNKYKKCCLNKAAALTLPAAQ